MNKLSPKLMVIGLDGATFDVIGPWLEKGKLPNLKALIENGVSGKLKSTVPPMSPVAWPSFYTGLNPGNHGIFDFFSPRREIPLKMQINSGANCQARPFWQYFDKAGIKVGVFNVPMTFPPDQLENGFMISGLDTPGIESDFVWPQHIKKEIEAAVGTYVIEAKHTPKIAQNPDRYLDLILDVIETREKTALYLLDHHTPELFNMVFTATDRAQHTLWRYMDQDHADYIPGYEGHIQAIFERVDQALGRILERADKNTDLIIMSDHGMQRVEKSIDLNQWLRENGYQTLKEVSFKDLIRFWSRDIGGLLMKAAGRPQNKMLDWQMDEVIDWEKTLAYYIGAWGCVFINQKGRENYGTVTEGAEKQALVDALKRDLEALIDPETGKPIIKSVFKSDEIYKGAMASQSPDLIIMWNEGYNGTKSLFDRTRNMYREGQVVIKSNRFGADHEKHGIFVFHSAKGKNGVSVENANIMDICPTLFYLMGQDVPEYLDGKVLTEVFDPIYLEKHPVRYSKSMTLENMEKDQGLSKGDAAIIADRLKDLGYME